MSKLKIKYIRDTHFNYYKTVPDIKIYQKQQKQLLDLHPPPRHLENQDMQKQGATIKISDQIIKGGTSKNNEKIYEYYAFKGQTQGGSTINYSARLDI